MKRLYWLADNEEPAGDTELNLQEGAESSGMEAEETSEEIVQETTEAQPTEATPQGTEQPQEAEPASPAPAPVAVPAVDWQKYAPVVAGVAVIGALIFFFMKKKQ